MVDGDSLIVVVAKSIQTEPFVSRFGVMAQRATIKAVSSNPELVFELRQALSTLSN